MKILLVSTSDYIANEIKDFLSLYNDTFYLARTNKQAINILNKAKVDYVLIDSIIQNEFKLIKYINENYSNVKVIITVQKELLETVYIIKHGKYDVLAQPFRLSDLKKQIEHLTKNKQEEK